MLFSHCQNVSDHFPCLPNFLLLNAKSKSRSKTDEICPRDRLVKFKNNTSGCERLWDTALKCLCPGVRFSKDPKTSRARKPSRKAPETTFGCFSKHPKNFEPEKYVIFPRKLHGYSLPPEKRFRVCFSCTCLIKWRPPTYFLGQNKRPRSSIKKRESWGGEREQCRKEIRILPKRISMANSS